MLQRDLIRTPILEDLPRFFVDQIDDTVDLTLTHVPEVRSLGKVSPKHPVHVLHPSLLPGGIRCADG